MKNKISFKIFLLFILVSLNFYSTTTAQNTLPDGSFPMIIVPKTQVVNSTENIISINVISNVSYTVDCDAKWIKFLNSDDNKVYFRVEANNDNTSRNADIFFDNTEEKITSRFTLVQAPNISDTMDDFDLILARVRFKYGKNPSRRDVPKYLGLIDQNTGKFTDINYDDKSYVNGWKAAAHLERLELLANAYTHKNSYYKGKEEIYNAVVKLLDYWVIKSPKNNNWWWNRIWEPQRLGETLAILRAGKKQIPAETEKDIIELMRMHGGSTMMNGANGTDVALHWIYRYCLTKDEKMLQYAIDCAFNTLTFINAPGGFQADFSYFMHGHQLYIGGYGDEQIKGALYIANYVDNTKFAMKKKYVDFLGEFMRNTYYRTIRGKYMLFDVMGRSVSRVNSLSKGSTQFLESMCLYDSNNKQEYEDIIARINGKQPASYGVKPMHTHYYVADWTLHSRPGYTFDVRMVSKRTAHLESGNQENKKCFFMSDGCTNIVVDGDEYYNLMPVWDWAKIPGTTAPQYDPVPKRREWEVYGVNEFAGGVSDTLYGATGFAYFSTENSINTGANKSWYFFDDEVVCLGVVNSTNNTKNVYTTINQCHQKSAPIYMNDGASTKELPFGSHDVKNPKWVLHNKVGYVFPQGGDIWVKRSIQRGTWNAINSGQKKDPVSHEVFSIGFDHKRRPSYVPYAYIVVPTLQTEEQMNNYLSKNAINIVSNTKEIQSVYHNNLNIWSVVFFEPSTLSYKDMKLTVDQKCIVMIRKHENGKYTLHVADPEQKLRDINLSVNCAGKSHNLKAEFSKVEKIYAGKTKAFKLN